MSDGVRIAEADLIYAEAVWASEARHQYAQLSISSVPGATDARCQQRPITHAKE